LALLPVLSLAVRLRRSNQTNVDFEMTLNNFQNVQYSAPLTLGGQTLPVIYDTGSFEILVLSSLCTSCSSNQIVYNGAQSHSFVEGDGITAEHMFGSGPVFSKKAQETVSMGPQGSPYAANHMPFWQVIDHNIDVWDGNSHFSGIVGLSHTDAIPEGFTVGDANDKTLLNVLGVQNFAICLQRDAPGAPGVLAMGPSINALANSPNFQSVPVVGQVHWGLRMREFRVPGFSHPNPCVPSCGAIVDSGTSLIAVPRQAVEAISGLANAIKSDCSNMNSLPILQFELDGATVELPPQAYVMQVEAPVYRNASVWDKMFGEPGSEVAMQCAPAFMTIDQESQFGPVWILGMPFLRYYYTVFDRAEKKIHIQRASATCDMPTGSAPTFGFMNSTGMSGASTFAASDYQPLKVDLNAARAPAWAFGKKAAGQKMKM